MARETAAGHWLVMRGEPQWLAWRYWLKREFQYKFFPEKLPVPQEWPPENTDNAMKVANYYRGLNADIEREEKSKSRGSFKPIPMAPTPWIRWSHTEMLHRVAEFNAQERV